MASTPRAANLSHNGATRPFDRIAEGSHRRILRALGF
jgi:hypothetical protein